MKKFLSIILCVIMMFGALSFTGCKDKNAVGESWKVNVYDSVEKQIVGFSLTRNSVNVKEVWLNVEKIEGNLVGVTVQKYTAQSSLERNEYFSNTSTSTTLGGGEISITAKMVKDANKEKKGWIKLNAEAWDKNYNNVLLSLKGNMTIREIVFVSMKGEIIKATVDRALVVVEYDDGTTRDKLWTLSDLGAITGAKYGVPTALLDSQDSFNSKDD
ncbi:MAG: hypothetical protein IJW64_03000 [Clostridia bacterium]|nr:hypothetical protein [Clostridia bacterium]